MARKNSEPISMRQQKLRLLERLFDAGIATDEAIANLQPVEMLQISDITTEDLRLLCDLQDSVKNGKTISFLAANANV